MLCEVLNKSDRIHLNGCVSVAGVSKRAGLVTSCCCRCPSVWRRRGGDVAADDRSAGAGVPAGSGVRLPTL
eukprot:764923-Hanusia_phi.AAC.9